MDTTLGLQGSVDYHQLPFRKDFSKRMGGGKSGEFSEMKTKHGGGHYVRVGDCAYSVTGD